jgi:hypothetical protein
MAAKLTRRQLAVTMAAGSIAAAPARGQEESAETKLEEARQEIRDTTARLKEFDLPMATAPAFVFEP